MTELIKVNYESKSPTISGRELHEALEVKTAYKDWFPRMCEYGFAENIDFCSNLSESTGGRPSIDHQLSINMAKEICMLQRSEKGKQFRQYFIAVENQWNTPEAVMARALKFAQSQLDSIKNYSKALETKVKQDAPKVLFADSVAASDSSILVGELAKIIKQNGVSIGQNRLFAWLRLNGFLISRKGTDRNMPTQKSMDLGLFEIKERAINNPDGSVRVTKTVKVTGKGQQYFVNKFLSDKSVPTWNIADV